MLAHKSSDGIAAGVAAAAARLPSVPSQSHLTCTQHWPRVPPGTFLLSAQLPSAGHVRPLFLSQPRLTLPPLTRCVEMQSAVALLESRMRRGQADLRVHYEQVSADKRLLLRRTIDTVAALDGDSDGSLARRRPQWDGSDHFLPLLPLLPLTDTMPPPKEDAMAIDVDGQKDDGGSAEAEEGAVAVLAVEAVYESGVADSGCCDGRWAVRAVIRSRSSHPLHALTLHAITAEQQLEAASQSSVLDSLPASSLVCLLCGVDVLSSTPATVSGARVLLRISHTPGAAVTVWSRIVQLPCYPYLNQRIHLFGGSKPSVDALAALSLFPLSSPANTVRLRLGASPPLADLSSLIQQHCSLRPIDHTHYATLVCGVADARLAVSDQLLVSYCPSSSSAFSPSACPFPGLCCVLSAHPSIVAACSLRLYCGSDRVALSFLSRVRAALPPSCTFDVDAAHSLSLSEVQSAVTALLAETEEAVSRRFIHPSRPACIAALPRQLLCRSSVAPLCSLLWYCSHCSAAAASWSARARWSVCGARWTCLPSSVAVDCSSPRLRAAGRRHRPPNRCSRATTSTSAVV